MTDATIHYLARERQQLYQQKLILRHEWGHRPPDRVQARIDEISRQIAGIDRDLDRMVPGSACRVGVTP